jgi:putative chitinase
MPISAASFLAGLGEGDNRDPRHRVRVVRPLGVDGMTMQLTTAALHAMMPQAPSQFIEAMAATQGDLASVGALESVNRLAYLFANIAEESGEFHETTENINYTPARACAVWPSRFHSVGDVYAKVGSWPGDPAFHQKLMDNVYGGRMGNRPGTHDGSEYIGRGNLQLTGREEYGAIAAATGLDLVNHPELATLPENQNKIAAAYIKLRGLNTIADRGDFVNYVRRINGGTIGMSTRQYYLSHMVPIVTSLWRQSRGLETQPAGGHTITTLQTALNKLDDAGLTVDGKIGPATTAAVREFQQGNGLQVDGIPGPLTWEAIDKQMAAP